MALYFENSGVAVDLRYEDQATAAHAAYWENGFVPVFTRADPPVISNFGASSGSGDHSILTLNNTEIPIDITVSADLSNATRWEFKRIVGSEENIVASGTTNRAFYLESLTSTFKPDSNGWHYLLTVWNGNTQVHASTTVRVVTAPTLTAFASSSIVGVQTPTGTFQRSYLTWDATSGDPESTWSISQTGLHIQHLPSSRHLTPAAGRATGDSRQFVQISSTPGTTTTLTLTGTNEAGSTSMSTTITWLGQG